MLESETPPKPWTYQTCGVIVAHPDDETLWPGGTLLMHPESGWSVVALCRKSDPDRAPKFFRALEALGTEGAIGDLDDGPDQAPLDSADVQNQILSLLPRAEYDLLITHSTRGEYTRHLRHEETAAAVLALWRTGQLKTRRLWMFAYDDNHRQHLPRAVPGTDKNFLLPADIWQRKYKIITEIYGFAPESWEARTTPKKEAFWSFRSPKGAQQWIDERIAYP